MAYSILAPAPCTVSDASSLRKKSFQLSVKAGSSEVDSFAYKKSNYYYIVSRRSRPTVRAS